jgi:FAD binding domain-containing protein
MSINLAKLSGDTIVIPDERLNALKARVRGTVLTEHDEGYGAARSVWNAMIDRRPAIIVRCAGAADVSAAVDFAREAGALLSVRGGGHNIAGSALADEIGAHRSVRPHRTRRAGCHIGRVRP